VGLKPRDSQGVVARWLKPTVKDRNTGFRTAVETKPIGFVQNRELIDYSIN
jgi:hypothetical protein